MGMRPVRRSMWAAMAVAVATSGCVELDFGTFECETSCKAAPVEGRVGSDEGSGGLPGVTIRIVSGPGAGQSTQTGPDGRFHLGTVDDPWKAPMVIAASLEGWATATETAVTACLCSASVAMILGRPPHRLTGTVERQGGGRVGGASLEIVDSVNRGKTTVADGDGAFVFPDLLTADHAFLMRVSAEGYQPQIVGVPALRRNSGVWMTLSPS